MNKFVNEDKSIRLFNTDAMELMDKMIEKGVTVDCVITDPPYKITARGNGGNSGGMFQKKEVNNGKVFEVNDLEIESWLPKLYNILKDTGHCYIMTNNKNIGHYLNVIDTMYFNNDKSQKFNYIKNLIWLKDNKIMGQAYMSQFEYIIFLRKGAFKKINNCGTSDVLQIPNKKMKDMDNKTIHDTEKPVELMEILISNSTQENETVFDPFCGLFPVGIACKKLNRKSIGCELDEKYYNVAVNIINEYERTFKND